MTSFTGNDPATTQTPPATPAAPAPQTPAPAAPTFAPEDVALLQKRLKDKDDFIETLKQERAQDRATLESLSQKLEMLLAAKDVLSPPATPATPAPAAPSISPDELRKQGFLTKDDLLAAEQAAIRKQNFQTVLEIGRKQFGEKLDEMIGKRCAEMGVTIEWAQQQAQNSPKVFMELFNLKDTKVTTPEPTTPELRTPLNPQNPAQPKRSVMHGATSKDVLAEWNRVGEEVRKSL